MNEIKQTFDYSVVDTNTASFLKLKEQEMQSIVLNSSVQLGEKLIEAQEKLAKYNTGTFEKWFVSLGLKKQTVYNYINQAKFVHQMDESKQIEMFQELPMTLKTEISKPSAEPEAVELVLSGDIKTTKEYRELEKQLKAKDEQIAMQAQMIDDLSEQEPEVIEKKVVVEKVPDDYHDLKSSNMALLRELNSVSGDYQKSSQLISDINAENEKLKAEQERLKREVNTKRQMENDELEQAQLKRLQRDADISVHKLILNLNEFVKEQAVTVYDSQAIAGASPDTKQKLDEGIKRVENLLKDIKQEIGGEVSWIIN